MSDYDNNSIRSLNDNDRGYMAQLEDDNLSVVTDDLSTKTVEKNPRKMGRRGWVYDDIKMMDSGYHRIVRSHDGIKTKTEVYSTSYIPGTWIRDAITGHKHPQFRVGSWNEDLFFKVKDTSGYVGTDTYCLYYDSPEQYERHFKVNISVEAKKKWTNKFVMAQARLESEQE
jgi:hypothetical protein